MEVLHCSALTKYLWRVFGPAGSALLCLLTVVPMSNEKAVGVQQGGILPGNLPGTLVTDFLRRLLWDSCAQGVGLQCGRNLKICKTWKAFNGQAITQPQEMLRCTEDALVKEARLNQKDFDNCWSPFGLCVGVRMSMDVSLLSDPSRAAHQQIPCGKQGTSHYIASIVLLKYKKCSNEKMWLGPN